MAPLDINKCRVEFYIDDEDDDRSIGADIYDEATGELVDRVERLHMSDLPFTVERVAQLYCSGTLHAVLYSRVMARQADEKIIAADRSKGRWQDVMRRNQ